MSPAILLAAAHGSVTTGQDVSIGHVLLQMVLALGVIVGGIWGFGKIMGRGREKRRPKGRSRGHADGLTILSRQMIGKGKSIAVVQAGEQCFLVGIGDAGLTPLGELTTAATTSGPGTGAGPDAGPSASGGPTPMTLASLAPLDVAGLDLAALVRSAPRPDAVTTGNGTAATGAGGRSGGGPSTRAWLDNLREATVRR